MVPKRRALVAFPILALLLFAVVLLITLRDDKIQLKWKLVEGQTLRYRSSGDIQYKNGTHETGSVELFEVKSIDREGTATLSYATESYQEKKSGATGDMDYSSQRGDPPPKDPMSRAIAQTLGVPLEIRLTPWGKMTEVTGFDAWKKA